MAISVVGQVEGNERSAAEELAKRLATVFRPQDNIIIVAGAKCTGERREDVDLFVLGLLGQGFRLDKSLLPPTVSKYSTFLSSFAMTIEVKQHDGSSVKFAAGNQVHVRYHGRWSDASDQAHGQKTAVWNFLERKIGKAPFVSSALWLRGVIRDAIPNSHSDVLGADCTPQDFLRLVVSSRMAYLERQVMQGDDKAYLSISACSRGAGTEIAAAIQYFSLRVEPGTLDRKKLEVVCQRILKGQQYDEKLGQQLLMFRGRGGAGKTLRLLQIARTLYVEKGARVLFLTYNKSLVADVRRLLSILGVGNKVGEQAIAIRSSDQFFFGMLKAWGIAPVAQDGEDFPAAGYLAKKRELADLLRGETPASIANERIAVENPDVFAWDYLLIDEGQDWPEDERDILCSVFGSNSLIVADGMDQLVRREGRCDWTRGPAVIRHQIVFLPKSLRLKANLCRFAQGFASDCGTEWDMEVNDEVSGGNVQLVLGDYGRALHEKIMSKHRSGKVPNLPIDALFCITGGGRASAANLPSTFRKWDLKVWDGTTEQGKQDYPTDVNDHRIVKYESCRGLEGWTVVCLDLDVFFDRLLVEGRSIERNLFESQEEAALRYAARWCLIPFTRAIDTLVVQVRKESVLGQRILRLSRVHEDFITRLD